MPNHVLEEVDLVVNQALSFQVLKSKLGEIGFDVENITNSDVVSLISEMVFKGTSHRLGAVVAEALNFRTQMRGLLGTTQEFGEKIKREIQANLSVAKELSVDLRIETALKNPDVMWRENDTAHRVHSAVYLMQEELKGYKALLNGIERHHMNLTQQIRDLTARCDAMDERKHAGVETEAVGV